jgi:dephospho-CoA kinase
MLIIGLTGGIGSGKSTVAERFRELGIEIIDADLIAREVVEPGQSALQSIADHFGEDIIDENGELKRSKLRELIFDDSNERTWLEQLLHPLINAIIHQRSDNCKSAYCLIMSPILLETNQKDMVDRVLVVDVSQATQIERTLNRDGSSQQTIEAIIASQISREKRLAAADDVLENEKDSMHLKKSVDALHQLYMAIATGF